MAHPYAHAKNFGHRKAASLKLGKLGPGAGAPPDNGPGQPMVSKKPMTPPQGGLGEGIPGPMGPAMKRGGTAKRRLDKRDRGGRILALRNQGLSQEDAEYFNKLQENPDIAHQAALAAQQSGSNTDQASQAFHDAVRTSFNKLSANASPVRTPSPDNPLAVSPRANEFFKRGGKARKR